MTGTKSKRRVHYDIQGLSPTGEVPVRAQCGEAIFDPERVTDEWASVPEEDRCIRCVKSLARTDIRARLDRIIYEAEQDPDGTVPAHLILTIGKAG